MKKWLSLILAAAMLLCACASLAEETSDTEATPMFRLSVTIPDGYTAVNEMWVDPYIVYVTLDSDDPTKPMIDVQISYEDLLSDVTFSRESWDTEEVQNYVAALAYDVETEQYDEYATRDTGLGTVILVIDEADYTRMLTVWHGYMITLFAADRDGEGALHPVSAETLDMIMKFLTDLDISKVIIENAA